MDQVRIAQQRLAEQVDVAERRAYEARGPGWVFPKIGVYNPPNHPLKNRLFHYNVYPGYPQIIH